MNKLRFLTSFVLLLLPIATAAQTGADSVGNVSINFKGKVLDDGGKPLDGAKVNIDLVIGQVGTLPGFPQQPIAGSRIQNLTLLTDENGVFTLDNRKGHGFDLKSISKEGYQLSKRVARSYYYTETAEPFHQDSQTPVIFKMWKSRGKEPLVQSSWVHKVSCDGTTNRFDLFSGHSNAYGTLEIVCWRSPVDRVPTEGKPFDYKLEIALRGGAVQPTSDEFTYLAPESGYSSRFIEEKKAGEQGWRGRLIQELYFKTSDGKYGRIGVDWYASQQNPTHLDWNCSINPSGSRNLER